MWNFIILYFCQRFWFLIFSLCSLDFGFFLRLRRWISLDEGRFYFHRFYSGRGRFNGGYITWNDWITAVHLQKHRTMLVASKASCSSLLGNAYFHFIRLSAFIELYTIKFEFFDCSLEIKVLHLNDIISIYWLSMHSEFGHIIWYVRGINRLDYFNLVFGICFFDVCLIISSVRTTFKLIFSRLTWVRYSNLSRYLQSICLLLRNYSWFGMVIILYIFHWVCWEEYL